MSRLSHTVAHVGVTSPCRLVMLLPLLGTLAWADEGWHEIRREADGLLVEARSVPGSAFDELRVRVHVNQRPCALADVAWAWREHGVEGRLIERRLVLSERPGERVVYQLLHPPLVSRRQSLVRLTREDARDGHTALIAFTSLEGALPEHEDAVRIPLIRGAWRFDAAPEGGTWLDYRCLSDPGGGLPPWLVANAQHDLAVELVREVMALAR